VARACTRSRSRCLPRSLAAPRSHAAASAASKSSRGRVDAVVEVMHSRAVVSVDSDSDDDCAAPQVANACKAYGAAWAVP
jgi:hypothetical protein